MGALRARSVALTGRLEERLRGSRFYVPLPGSSVGVATTTRGEDESKGEGKRKFGFMIVTPSEAEARGAQLSLRIFERSSSSGAVEGEESERKGMGEVVDAVAAGLKRRGVLGDERRPDVMRFAPVPLYCTFGDCERAARALEEVFEEMEDAQ